MSDERTWYQLHPFTQIYLLVAVLHSFAPGGWPFIDKVTLIGAITTFSLIGAAAVTIECAIRSRVELQIGRSTVRGLVAMAAMCCLWGIHVSDVKRSGGSMAEAFANPLLIGWRSVIAFLAFLSVVDLLGWAFNRLTRKREAGRE